ncbi:alpha/beta hydrolase [uncultured Marinobacter sp.]|uniref:alpha/beta fold hydrolase n=1 Tax=uncultured Marinobacter sp. TaxID=187379 RepID=UPI0030D7451D
MICADLAPPITNPTIVFLCTPEARVTEKIRNFWLEVYRQNYRGDQGRERLRTCAINLRDRDGLHARLNGIICPVLWIHGTADSVYSVANAEDGIARFTNAREASLKVIDGGQHFLSASDPDEVNAAAVEFIGKWAF